MAGSVNRMHIIGNLGADPEVRQTQDGRSICNLRVATTDSWRDKTSGERREATEWHAVAIFNEQLVKIAQQYLKKGSKVWICGPLKTRKWQDSNGNDRYTTEIVLQGFSGELTMLDGPSGGAQSENRSSPPQSRQNSGHAPKNNMAARQLQSTGWDDVDDSIPFLD